MGKTRLGRFGVKRVIGCVATLSAAASAQVVAPPSAAPPDTSAPATALPPPDASATPPAGSSPSPTVPASGLTPEPAPAITRYVTVVADTMNPECGAAANRCEGTGTLDDAELARRAEALLPMMRSLRRCLDQGGANQAPAGAVVHWSARGVALEKGTAGGVIGACLDAFDRELIPLAGQADASLRCSYTCEPRRPAPPPLASAAPPPAADTKMNGASSSSWYGWQTLSADGASLGLLAIGLGSWTVESTAIGYGGFLLGTPVVHAVHGNVGRAFGSFLLRLLIPTVAGAIGGGVSILSALGDGGEPDLVSKDVVTAAGIGMAIGGAGCVLIDGAAFAYETTRPGASASIEPRRRSSSALRLSIGPTVGVGGSF